MSMTAEQIIQKIESFVVSERRLIGGCYPGPYDDEATLAEMYGKDAGREDVLDDLEHLLKEIRKGMSDGTFENQGRQG